MSGLVPFNKRRRELLSNDNSLFNMLDDFFSGSMPMMRSLDADTFKVDVKDLGDNYEITAEIGSRLTDTRTPQGVFCVCKTLDNAQNGHKIDFKGKECYMSGMYSEVKDVS